jgi:hypothetical protein
MGDFIGLSYGTIYIYIYRNNSRVYVSHACIENNVFMIVFIFCSSANLKHCL